MGLLELRQGEVVAGHEGLCGVVVRVEGGEVGGVELVASVTKRTLMLLVVGKALLMLDLGQDGRQPRRGVLRLRVLLLLNLRPLCGILAGLFAGVLPLGVLVEVPLGGEGLGALVAREALPVGAVPASHLKAQERTR